MGILIREGERERANAPVLTHMLSRSFFLAVNRGKSNF